MRFAIRVFALSLSALVAGVCLAADGRPVLSAEFSPVPPKMLGPGDPVWDRALASDIDVAEGEAAGSARVQAVWSGPTLFLLISVTDPGLATGSLADSRKAGVQIFVDQFDDKFPKFEEDDGFITVNSLGQQTGNRTNAGLRYYPSVWSTHLESSAAISRYDANGKKLGYAVEIAWSIGDLPLRNGTRVGMEFAVSFTTTGSSRLYWSSARNRGLDDNTMWGDVELRGYDGRSRMPLNTYMLRQNIRKAAPAESSDMGLVRDIWKSEIGVDRALEVAEETLRKAERSPNSTHQTEIDSADRELDAALRGLRREGDFPDPFDLPSVNHLPDPFQFLDGSRVRTEADWKRRRDEIQELAQYYEFGQMPDDPDSVSAVSTAGLKRTLTVMVEADEKHSSFQPVLYLPTTGKPPYPVIVQETFRASAPPNKAFLDGGYAVLNIPTTDSPSFGAPGVASDDGNHTGAFYELYPYKLDSDGDDRGVLLAWAWGASRGVDALAYLGQHDRAYKDLLDLDKLVVTGFSRWGKAALLAGFLDDRFQVTAPGGSGSGGAAPYRYDSFGNRPFRKEPFGNLYPWGRSPGAETFGDHVRHQTHNSNEMIRRFLNDGVPSGVEPRMYLTKTWGYADRLPYDHHEIIAAIAPRAVIIDNTNDDYADNAEGDAIGYEGAMPVFRFLGVPKSLALDIYMGGGGHSLKPSQAENIVRFSDMVLFDKPLPSDIERQLMTDPYREAGTYDRYYGGLRTMIPWAGEGRRKEEGEGSKGRIRG